MVAAPMLAKRPLRQYLLLAAALLVAAGVALHDSCSSSTSGPMAASSAGPDEACAPGREEPCLRACDSGNDAACEELSMMYLRGVLKSHTKAAALSRRLCEDGRQKYCPDYAMALSEGLGVARDRARARELFIATCSYDTTACSEFGNLYATGNGVERDLELGHLLLDLACRHGDAQACRDLQSFSKPAPSGSAP
jgi:TPR repeat protein